MERTHAARRLANAGLLAAPAVLWCAAGAAPTPAHAAVPSESPMTSPDRDAIAGEVAHAGAAQQVGGWLSEWRLFHGGFDQLDLLAVAADGTGWGADVALIDRVHYTVFVRIEGDHLAATQVEEGLELTDIALRGADGLAAAELDNRGAVLRLADGRWVVEHSTARPLLSVAFTSDGGAWGVGDFGTTLVKGPAGDWETVAFPDGLARLVAVAAPPSGPAWCLDDLGRLYRSEADTWAAVDAPRVTRPAALDINDTWGLAVGRNMLVYRNGSWTEQPSPGEQIDSVALIGATAYAAVDGGIKHFDGTQWSPVTMPVTPIDVSGQRYERVAAAGDVVRAAARQGAYIDVRPPVYLWPRTAILSAIDAGLGDVAWAGGGSWGHGMVGSRPADGDWRLAQPVAPETSVLDVDIIADAGWAFGATPSLATRTWRWDGEAWDAYDIDGSWRLRRVRTLGPNEAWASGTSTVARWNGDSWKLVEDAPHGRVSGPLAMARGGADPGGWFGGHSEVHRLADGAWTAYRLEGAAPPLGSVVDLELASNGAAWAISPFELRLVADGAGARALESPGQWEVSQHVDLSVSPQGHVWLLTSPDGLYLMRNPAQVLAGAQPEWEWHALGPLGGRVAPERIQALDHEADPGEPAPEGWDGLDVWLVGASATVARYRVVTPSYRLYMPRILDRR